MDADKRRGPGIERLPSGDWVVTFPDGWIEFYATELWARQSADAARIEESEGT